MSYPTEPAATLGSVTETPAENERPAATDATLAARKHDPPNAPIEALGIGPESLSRRKVDGKAGGLRPKRRKAFDLQAEPNLRPIHGRRNVKVQETPPELTPPEQLDSRAGDRQEKVKEGSDSQKAQSSGDQDSEGPQYEEMDVASTSGSVTKRSRDQATGEQDHTGDPTSEEPPPKAVVTRRPTFRPKPNIPPDRKPAVTRLV
ncbi:hypothetical protein HPB49_021499 [Dermacentor silvarum]|uniref:Uncharacterized protein n=1 Tax=Dermacentor silvarum TaxID=543639 RepID=A0ACB8CHJ3_DERSI|nr:hypothetical protein HPB49_021499 [Dermacentor silvarum]